MGGRGRESPSRRRTPPHRRRPSHEELGYEAITPETKRGGARYPFLEETDRAWSLVSYEVQGPAPEVQREHSFGMAEPTLRWVSDNGVTDLYVDGMDTRTFLAETGLELSLDKGGYVLSKRLSRALRSYFISGSFDQSEVRIAYMQQDQREAKVWDGAGLISRAMLRKMLATMDLDEVKRDKLERELVQAGRVEVTIQSAKGQDKNHSIVAEVLHDDEGNEVDFLLPEDTKGEVKLVNGQTFVGLGLVHGHDQMRLDIQSLIHLRPFLHEKDLLARLKEEGDLFIEGIRSGQAAELMARIDKNETVEDVQHWHLREFLACGGNPHWFGSHVGTLLGQHLKRLNHSTLEKLRLPLPGGRYYVMPAGVGQRAGVQGLAVGRGEVKIDPQYETAWVSDEDWLALTDSPQGEGIAGILGGADNDDALWLFPFTDEVDGEQKVLAWRSPNQLGEYVVLNPTADSPDLAWPTTEGALSYPRADSRALPERIDRREVQYLGLVDPATAGGLGEGEAYSVAAMERAMERAQANTGALGSYCNSLMVHKVVTGNLPEHPPAPLEDFIDASVKTGADLSAGKAWCYEHTRELLEEGQRVPRRALRRLAQDREGDPTELIPPPLTTRAEDGHWFDTLDEGVTAHIQHIEETRAELVREAMPPARLFDAVFAEPEMLGVGAQFNRTYASTLRRLQRERQKEREVTLARRAAEESRAYLAQYDAETQEGILRRKFFEDAWRKLARDRPTGSMGAAEHAEATRLADEQLRKTSPHRREATLYERVYTDTRRRLERELPSGLVEEDHAALRECMEAFLDQWPEEQHTAILRGAMVSVHLGRSQSAQAHGVWLPGPEREDGTRAPGIAQTSLQALREIGLLDEVDETEGGVIVYPAAEVQEPTYRMIGLQGVWANWYEAYRREQGREVPDALNEIPPHERQWAKQQVAALAQGTFQDMTLEVRREGEALVAYTERGNKVGTLSRDSQTVVGEGEQVRVRGALARDGNLRVAIG